MIGQSVCYGNECIIIVVVVVIIIVVVVVIIIIVIIIIVVVVIVVVVVVVVALPVDHRRLVIRMDTSSNSSRPHTAEAKVGVSGSQKDEMSGKMR